MLGDTDPDTATGKEGDVEARCFRMSFPQRQDSTLTIDDRTRLAERPNGRDTVPIDRIWAVVMCRRQGEDAKGRD